MEICFSRDPQMKEYYCIEIDSRGRAYDYRAAYYRQFDRTWHCEGLETAATAGEKSYVVEGRIPLATFVALGFPQFSPGARIPLGLYRAEFSHDPGGKSVEQSGSIHTGGRKLDGPPLIQQWISWVNPKTPEPDFHVPSSLGWLEIEE